MLKTPRCGLESLDAQDSTPSGQSTMTAISEEQQQIRCITIAIRSQNKMREERMGVLRKGRPKQARVARHFKERASILRAPRTGTEVLVNVKLRKSLVQSLQAAV